jgi:hypothetical protein
MARPNPSAQWAEPPGTGAALTIAAFRIFYDDTGRPMYSTDPGSIEANFAADGSGGILIVEGAPRTLGARAVGTDLVIYGDL